MGKRRCAQIVAELLNVLCPYCGEAQPNPDNGGEMWTAAEVRRESTRGARACVSCDELFRIHEQKTAQVLS